MQLKLRVIGGKNDGRELDIKIPEFIIGRGEGVNLRPKSDLISRHHCAVLIEEGQVFAKDLESRNGTFVNGEKITGKVQLQVGDRLRVGRLLFEVLIDHGIGGHKKPKVANMKEAAERTAASSSNLDEDSITDWLSEPDAENKSRHQTILETRQFRLDETDRVVLDEFIGNHDADSAVEEPSKDETVSGHKDDSSVLEKPDSGKPKSKKPGKLPERQKSLSGDSTDAASDMLRKFFNRR